MPINSVGPSAGNNAPQSVNPQSEQAASIQRIEATRTETRQADARASNVDTVEISSEARRASDVGKVKAAEETEEIRNDLVDEARQFLAAGLYNDDGVLEQTAQQVAPFVQIDA